MKTLTVTHGEWVSYRTNLVLPDAEYERLQGALETDEPRQRREAQRELLQRLQRFPDAPRHIVARSEPALEAIDFETGVGAASGLLDAA